MAGAVLGEVFRVRGGEKRLLPAVDLVAGLLVGFRNALRNLARSSGQTEPPATNRGVKSQKDSMERVNSAPLPFGVLCYGLEVSTHIAPRGTMSANVRRTTARNAKGTSPITD